MFLKNHWFGASPGTLYLFLTITHSLTRSQLAIVVKGEIGVSSISKACFIFYELDFYTFFFSELFVDFIIRFLYYHVAVSHFKIAPCVLNFSLSSYIFFSNHKFKFEYVFCFCLIGTYFK